MKVIEMARKLAEYQEVKEAQQAYILVLQECQQKEPNPELEMEAASYLFFSKGNYQIAFSTFVSLYNRGHFQEEIWNLMTQAVYLPNIEAQRRQYEENCKYLAQYPYFFRKDFLSFEELPILFFPFNDQGFIPFFCNENRFGEYVNFNHPVIDRNFFHDLENPILAKDVYSQYQLEYLNDNVRKSEWIARENHIYLHYTSWIIFCTYLTCLKLRKLLKEEKFVFLIEEEIAQYPIDFKEKFGIDYSQYPVKPIGIREVNKMIWHTQLASHNGGDFFNEVFYGHPNLLVLDSMMLDNVIEVVSKLKEGYKQKCYESDMVRALSKIKNPTDKDFLVAFFLYAEEAKKVDPAERIVPALFFQPHFPNMVYTVQVTNNQKRTCILYSEQYEQVQKSPLFLSFPYIKTFTPMRRPTTSYAATNRFIIDSPIDKYREENEKGKLIHDLLTLRILNRSFMIDWQDRLYMDSRLVRFEDGKLNPKATFTALAAFLDIPYTESMTYCSSYRGINQESMQGNAIGFDPSTVYKTYEEFTNDAERALIEYCFQDAYQQYGYDFQYYQGETVDEEWLKETVEGCTRANEMLADMWRRALSNVTVSIPDSEMDDVVKSAMEVKEKLGDPEQAIAIVLEHYNKLRFEYSKYLLDGARFINRRGQPLHLMPPLELDPELLEQPLYH